MKRLCIIQPLLSYYSRETFLELAALCLVDLVFSTTPSGTGFGDVARPEDPRVRCFLVPTYRPFGKKMGMIQWGLGRHILRERPDAILISADPRYLSFWTTLFWSKLLGIPTYAHGHGLLKKKKISALYRIMMMVLLELVTSYICYAPIVRQSFVDHGFPGEKLTVAHNSLTNYFPAWPQEKTGKERGIFFIGRVRRGSKVGLLVRVIERIRREEGIPLTLHVIGSGEETQLLDKETYDRPWIVLHGEIYDQERIRKISMECFLGCYPGNAGLSVVHMMSLSLPVITHGDMHAHGPEPSFIRNGVSGLFFDHENPEETLYQAVRSLATDPVLLTKMQQGSFEDYQRLVNPPLAARFWSIIDDTCKARQTNSGVAPAGASNTSAEGLPRPHDSASG